MRPNIHDWLAAVVQSWPFVSEAAFAGGLVSLDRDYVGGVAGLSATVWQELEQVLRTIASGLSIESLRQLRDLTWFAEADHVPLSRHLRRIAGGLLKTEGSTITITGHPSLEVNAARFRWLGLAMPADLLVAASCQAGDIFDADDFANLWPPHLTSYFQGKRFADTHLHLGAAIPFSMLWSGLMRDVGNASFKWSCRADDRLPFGSGKISTLRLLDAATSRCVLAFFLAWHDRGRARDLNEFTDQPLWWICGQLAGRGDVARSLDEIRRSLQRLLHPPADAERAAKDHVIALRIVYGRLAAAAAGPSKPIDTVAALLDADPLAQLRGSSTATPEHAFTIRALRYLEASPYDRHFGTLFWQYTRIRGVVHNHLVEGPGTAGLDWFNRYFGRISALRGSADGVTFDAALRTQSRQVFLRSIEGRAAPPERWVDVRDACRVVARQTLRFAEPLRPEVGLVFHFKKERQFSAGGTTTLHGDPRQAGFRCRYGAWTVRQRRAADAIRQAMELHPELLAIIRGVDVASVELAIPTWPLMAVIPPLREASHRIAMAWRPEAGIRPLQVTLHAGEDFRSPLEGLRRMHEPIEFGLLSGGDRIGHGVALGINVERWLTTATMTVLPAEERLQDLLWEYARYVAGDVQFDSSRLAAVEWEIAALGKDIFGESDIGVLSAARKLLHDPHYLDRIRYPWLATEPTREASEEERLAWRQLTSVTAFRRGQRPYTVQTTAGEIGAITTVQRWLKQQFSTLPITIETNTSSNLLIGDLLDLDEHPSFRMRPLPNGGGEGTFAVPLSINSDNPLTFATTLADEFAHIYHALIRKQTSAQAALRWLDERREDGFLSRFTLDASRYDDTLHAIAATTYVRSRRRM